MTDRDDDRLKSDSSSAPDPLGADFRTHPQKSSFWKSTEPFEMEAEDTLKASDSMPMDSNLFDVLPRRFGRYQVIKELGRGQMGMVYLALDERLDRPVALKVARCSSSTPETIFKRMEIEAKAAAVIDHPLICKVYDIGEIDGIRFIAMQYIEGQQLKETMKQRGRPFETAEAVAIVLSILRALQAAHQQRVIHRDLKPDNIMINQYGEPVIMDFGLVRKMDRSTDAGLTQEWIVGTPAYMSPEQTDENSDDIDFRSDLYSVGVILFEMLTGRWPFTGDSLYVMRQKCQNPAPSPSLFNPRLSPPLAAICQKLIARDKEDRYFSCAQAIDALASLADLGSASQAPVASDNQPTLLLSKTQGVSAVESASVAREAVAAKLVISKPFFDFSNLSDFFLVREIRSIQKQRRASYAERAFRRWMFYAPLLVLVLIAAILFWPKDPERSAAAGILTLVLTATIVLWSRKAHVWIDIDDEEIRVTSRHAWILATAGTHECTLPVGEQRLQIQYGGDRFETARFSLKSGANPDITIELIDSEIVTRLGGKEFDRHAVSRAYNRDKDQTQKKCVLLTAGGTWVSSGQELIQTDRDVPSACVSFGDNWWTDYDFTADVMRAHDAEMTRDKDAGEFSLIFRASSIRNCYLASFWRVSGGVQVQTDGRIESIGKTWNYSMKPEQWYTISVSVRGPRIQCFIKNGRKEVCVADLRDDKYARGRVGLRCVKSSFRFKNIRVMAPDGRVLGRTRST